MIKCTVSKGLYPELHGNNISILLPIYIYIYLAAVAGYIYVLYYCIRHWRKPKGNPGV